MEGTSVVQAGMGPGAAAAGGILEADLLLPISRLFCSRGALALFCILGSTGPSVRARFICCSGMAAGWGSAWLHAGSCGCCGLLS